MTGDEDPGVLLDPNLTAHDDQVYEDPPRPVLLGRYGS